MAKKQKVAVPSQDDEPPVRELAGDSSFRPLPQPIVRGHLIDGGARRFKPKDPSLWRDLCQDVLDEYELVHRLAMIGGGLIGEIKYDRQGNRVYCEMPGNTQVKAIETLLSYGIGKTSEKNVKHTGLLGFFARLEQMSPEELEQMQRLAVQNPEAFGRQIAEIVAPRDDG